jgi:hypothetical protein
VNNLGVNRGEHDKASEQLWKDASSVLRECSTRYLPDGCTPQAVELKRMLVLGLQMSFPDLASRQFLAARALAVNQSSKQPLQVRFAIVPW